MKADQKNQFGASPRFTLAIGKSTITHLCAQNSDIPKQELLNNTCLFFRLTLKAQTQWIGTECTIRIFHGISEIYTSNFHLGATTEHDFSLTINNEKFILIYEIKINYIRSQILNDFNSEIAECILVDMGNKEELKYKKALVDSGHEYSKSLGLDASYFSDLLVEKFIQDISHSIRNKIGFSAVRIGDGEGRVLGYPDFIGDQEILQQVFNYQFGRLSVKEITRIIHDQSLSSQVLLLKSLIKNSIVSADYVGLPVSNYFKDKDFKITSGLQGYSMGLFVGGSLASRQINSGKILGSNFFQILAKNYQYFSKIFQTEPLEVITVNCHNLTAPLALKFNIKCPVTSILTPPHYTWSEGKSHGQFPYLYKNIVNEIIDMGNLEGKLFLVGAGLLGKHYCHTIKSQGGCAIDIGSVFDAWAKNGRPDAVHSHKIDKLI